MTTWLTSSAPQVTITVNTCLRQVPMMYMKSQEHAIDNFRTYLGHMVAVDVEFSLVS